MIPYSRTPPKVLPTRTLPENYFGGWSFILDRVALADHGARYSYGVAVNLLVKVFYPTPF